MIDLARHKTACKLFISSEIVQSIYTIREMERSLRFKWETKGDIVLL